MLNINISIPLFLERGTNGKRGLEDILDSLMERESSDEFGSEEESEEELRRSLMTEDDEEEEEEEEMLL